MPPLPIDALARHLSAQDRRTSLKTLALGLAVATAAPLAAGAKGGKNKAGKQARRKCKRQQAPCLAELEPLCAPGNTNCLDRTAECCAALGRCDAATAINCIVGVFII